MDFVSLLNEGGDVWFMFGSLDFESLLFDGVGDTFERCTVIADASDESPFFRFLVGLNRGHRVVIESIEPVRRRAIEIHSNLVSRLVKLTSVGEWIREFAWCFWGRQQQESVFGHMV
jgi:hypothetical protein